MYVFYCFSLVPDLINLILHVKINFTFEVISRGMGLFYLKKLQAEFGFHFHFTGVLLYGPPGCGKTLIAKATAKASGCRFVNLQASTLTDKWYGESQKLTAAVFSLAVKIQPCIIFIDEIGNLCICSSNSS